MINRSEFIAFRSSDMAKRINELLQMGKEIAVDQLVQQTGQDGDFARGAIRTCEEMLDALNTGEGIYDIDDLGEENV